MPVNHDRELKRAGERSAMALRHPVRRNARRAGERSEWSRPERTAMILGADAWPFIAAASNHATLRAVWDRAAWP